MPHTLLLPVTLLTLRSHMSCSLLHGSIKEL